MPHAQPRMPSGFDVPGRSPETKDQEVAQPLLSLSQIRSPVHRPQNVIVRDAAIERRGQTGETLGSDRPVDLSLVH